MQQLKEIKIEKSNMVSFPEVLLEMENLEAISFAFTPLNILHEDLWRIRGLKRLNLRGTNITTLPDGLDFVEEIDMRMIEFTKAEQDQLRVQYPQAAIYFSAPCKCY